MTEPPSPVDRSATTPSPVATSSSDPTRARLPSVEKHVFEPDLMGDCAECPLPEGHPAHLPAAIADPPEPDGFTPAIPPVLSSDIPLGSVIAYVREHAEQGVTCPACTQLAKVYRRKINTGMAHALIEMFKHARRDWFYLPEITSRWQGRDEAGLRYWSLIESDPDRVGWWRVTEQGEQFLRCRARVFKYARVYDGRCLGLEGDPVTVRDSLGEKFDYDAMMAGV